MKNLRLKMIIASLLMALTIAPIQAENSTERPVMTHSDSIRVNALVARIDEIKELDKSNLAPAEKKALRKEVREMKREVREGNGIYLSLGAIIVTLLLLILLL